MSGSDRGMGAGGPIPMRRFVEVAVPVPVEGRFHYAVPDDLELAIGHRVLVPFGPRKMTGFVLAHADDVPEAIRPKVKAVIERLDRDPLIPEDVLHLARFAADYYLAPIGEVLKVALPPGLTGGSVLRLVATREGRAFLKSGAPLGDAELAILKQAAKAAGVRGPKAKSKAANELRALGLIEDEEFEARKSANEIEIAKRAISDEEAAKLLERSPAQRRVWDLLADGPRELSELREAVGRDSLSRALKKLAGAIAIERVPRAEIAPVDPSVIATGHLVMSEEQDAAHRAILAAFERGSGDAFLLHGVTGSGKTEVYLQAIAHVRERGRGAIVLVPEIALTPQLENRFRARFGDDVVVLHSGIAEGERRKRWRMLRDGEARIALGARSALWAPVKDLAMIVVDEEHDPSFKQANEVRYHGRDLALLRARHTKSVAILGSATPSLETLHLSHTGRITELRLSSRVAAKAMPIVQVVDLAEEKKKLKGEVHLLSRAMEDGLRAIVEKKEQAILFLNRRGFNTIVHCDDCGDARTCPSCDVSLTHHKSGSKLRCHYCDHEEPFRSPCRKCKSMAMRAYGAGTERIAELVQETIPGARVIRLDRDTTSRVGALEETLASFRAGEADVMVGTQMVAKGHDFPNVTFVGILLADASLAFPDFRAAERTFQLLTQVAGRAGRADRPGRVVVQTFQPEHYALQAALTHDTDGFFALEAPMREKMLYPPHARLGVVRIESRDAHAAESAAHRIASLPVPDEVRIKGPAPAPIGRIKEYYRWLVLVLAPTPARLSNAMKKLKIEAGEIRKVDLTFDVDAIDLL
jgi:primosomal protein N' (replication factor Y) (superfamily II helicase)